jgi:hypothetical protein
VAGNLGTSALQNAACALETVLCNRPNAQEVRAEFTVFEQLMAELVRGLKATPTMIELTPATRMHDLTNVEIVSARKVASDFKQCLKQDDARASELWGRHALVLRALYPDAAPIETAICNVDFEIALKRMDHSA